jgi:transposase
MNFNMIIPGLREAVVTKVEESGEYVHIFVEMERRVHRCPGCGQRTSKIHDYCIQKLQHLKWFERKTQFYYIRRRYSCRCGKRFSERITLVNVTNVLLLSGIRPLSLGQ